MTIDAPSKFSRTGHSVRALANWILNYADEIKQPITNMGLNKLLYFAYEELLFRDHVIITNAKIEAWEHGPVFREVYHAFKDYADRPIKGRASFFSTTTGEVEESTANLTESEESALKAALLPFMSLSAAKLRQLSHVDNGAWYRVWWYDGHANPGMEITPELIWTSRGTRHSS